MALRFKKGIYTPINPDKYTGDVNKIIYRSSWEERFNIFLDTNENVIHWSSEELYIPYVKPTDGKVHRYFPDYWVEYENTKGEIVQEIIEIKPAAQTRRPRTKKLNMYGIQEQIAYAVNVAKWKAAQQFCDAQGIKFRILTENELFR